MVTAQTQSEEISDSATSIWETVLDAIPRVAAAAVIVLVGWAASRGIRWLLHRAFLRRRTPSFAQVMSKVLGWLVLTIVVLLAIAVTFPSVKPVNVLTGLGFVSVAVGFAFQDILENTLAGILLLFRQPFRAGDQVEVVEHTGTVTEINIRETRLATFEGETVIIPNRDVYKGVIRVQTSAPVHRCEFVVGIAFENDAAEATAAIEAALVGVPYVQATPPPAALVSELGVSTVHIRVQFWTGSRQADSLRALDAAMKAVKAALDARGIEMPADIVVLQAAPSFRAAIQDDETITPGGSVRPNPSP